TQEYRTGVIGKGSSRPIRPYFFRPDRTNRSRVITENRTGVIGKGSSLPIRPYFFRPDRTNRSRVITENQTSVVGKGSSHPVRPCFFRPDRTNRSRVITHRGEPERGLWKGLVAPSTHIFFSSRSDQSEPSYYASTRTGSGSLERARRGLYAHIFFVQIGPIGAELLRFKGNKGQKHFSLTIFFSETIAPRRTGTGTYENRIGVLGKGSSRPTRPYFFYQDRTNRSRVITHVEKPDRGHWKGLFAPSPRRTGPRSLERARRGLYAHIFFVQIGPIGAELLRFKGNKGQKHFSLTIFFSETIAPRRTGTGSLERAPPTRTGSGSLERARRDLYAHIFFVQIGPIGAELLRFKGNKGKKHFSLTIFFSETIAPRSTGPGSLERARRALYSHIFFVQIELGGAEL
ncbi:hypothetical protein V1477_004490, partial [Vespula maculifrons]